MEKKKWQLLFHQQSAFIRYVYDCSYVILTTNLMYEFSEVMKTYRQGFLITILATMFDDAKCPISIKQRWFYSIKYNFDSYLSGSIVDIKFLSLIINFYNLSPHNPPQKNIFLPDRYRILKNTNSSNSNLGLRAGYFLYLLHGSEFKGPY